MNDLAKMVFDMGVALNRAAAESMPKARWTLTEPSPGIVGLEIITAAGTSVVVALTEAEADKLHNDLGTELFDRDVRSGRIKFEAPPGVSYGEPEDFDPDAGNDLKVEPADA